MAKLIRLEARALYAPWARLFGGADKIPRSLLAPSAQFRRVPRTGQHSTLVIAESDDGFIGVGEAFGLPHSGASACLIEGIYAPALVGLELGHPAAMLEPLRNYLIGNGQGRGPAMEALSGVDIALWDLRARRAGKPLATLLGASPGLVNVYVSPVQLMATPQESAAATREFLAQGFHAVKLKVGRGIATDLSHVEAVYDVLGPSRELRLDVNCSYDVPTAIEFARALKPFSIAWLEEPIRPDDPAALAEVRRAAPMPIAAGENEFLVESYTAFARAGAVDALMPNISRAGGVSGMLAVGEMCGKYNVGLAPQGVGSCVSVSAVLHVCRAIPAFTIFEANRFPNPLRDELGRSPIVLEDGKLLAPDAPGHGCEVDWRLAETYRIPAPGSLTPAEAAYA